MMNSILLDAKLPDNERRAKLYDGTIFLHSATPATQAFITFTRKLIEEAFKGLDPVTAQYKMEVEEYVAILSKLKPAFIHHPESKKHLQQILIEAGCDPETTYFDVPRMRSSTSDGYLTSGIAYAFHPHRDTWYSAPMCQINWWLPIYEIEAGNTMALHPSYFNKAIKNSSNHYNYQEWMATSRKEAAKHIKKDTRVQPKPIEDLDLSEAMALVPPPGGRILFSAAHLHSSVANTTGKTRFSIDFRVVNLTDLQNEIGAKNWDSACTGTNMGDYLRVKDLTPVSQEIINQYLEGHPQKAVLESV